MVYYRSSQGLSSSEDIDDLLLEADVSSRSRYYFEELLTQFPEKQPIPDAVVCFGILTEQLKPESGNSIYLEISRKYIEQVPPAGLSSRGVHLTLLLLRELVEELPESRKRLVGRLCESGRLNRPSTTSGDASIGIFEKAVSYVEKENKETKPQSSSHKNNNVGDNSESFISSAKKKANAQGRDAAIDPLLNKKKANKNHLLNKASEEKE